MPKRRRPDDEQRGSGGGVEVLEELFAPPVDTEVNSDIRTEAQEPAGGAFISARITPAWSGSQLSNSLLDTPLSIADGEVSRWRELWDKFRNDPSSLSSEEIAELYSHSTRRLRFALRRYARNRANDEEAKEVVGRMMELSLIEAAIDMEQDNPEFHECRRRNAELFNQEAVNLASNNFDPTQWESEREEVYNKLRQIIPDHQGYARYMVNDVSKMILEQARRKALPIFTTENDVNKLSEAYTKYSNICEAFSPYLVDDAESRAFHETWRKRWRDTIISLQRRAPNINIDSNTPNANGYLPNSDEMVALLDEVSDDLSINYANYAFLVPSDIVSDSFRRHAEELGISIINPADMIMPHNRNFDFIINWGASIPENMQNALGDYTVFNSRTTDFSNKEKALSILGELSPRTTKNPETAVSLFGDRIIAKNNKGSKGRGKKILDFTQGVDRVKDDMAKYTLFQEYFPNRREWRVNVFKDSILSAYSKQIDNETLSSTSIEKVSELPKGVYELALKARERSGLDYAGIDIVQDVDTGKYYVLELNTAPGMSEDTMKRLIQEAVRYRNRTVES